MLRNSKSASRLDILDWLKDPAAHFPPQRHTDLADDGVTVRAVAARLGVSRKVAGTHLGMLTRLGLLRTRRIRHRTYYRRDEIRIAQVNRIFEKGW
ncbi:winged helix-turn-helix domain-containing protein [Streptomyces sp. NPDC005917]|uniref:winged helix-turn-helix domain-containing protein n=1 Tax=unclassified Streptomyces TaxID=2593676 RepID=UPI0033C8A4A1